MAVITPPEIATAAGAVPSGVTTRVLRTTRSARTMAGETIRRQAQESPGREAPVVRCGNPVTSRRNTRAVSESLLFSDSVGFAHGRRKGDRKSTRLNSSHGYISYAVFCLKKKNMTRKT